MENESLTLDEIFAIIDNELQLPRNCEREPGEFSSTEYAERKNIATSTAVRRLSKLMKAGKIVSRKKGSGFWYKLA